MKIKGLLSKLVDAFSKEEEKYEFLTLNENILGYYRKNVKGNKGISEDQARRKMTRNMQLAFKFKEESAAKKSPRSWYSYGCLRFIVQDGKITWMQNWMKPHKVWKMDQEKYLELSEAYGIEDYKTF